MEETGRDTLERQLGDADGAVAALLAGNLAYDPDTLCDHHGHGEGHDCGHHHGGHDCGHTCGN